jgi:hypothetical protein
MGHETRETKARRARGGAKSTALARVGDPLITDKGAKIHPEGYVNGRPLPKEKPSLVLDAITFRPIKKRNLKELPAEVGTINGISAVFMYTMLGVGDREIADALGIDVRRVEDVRAHSAYKECFDTVVDTFINKNSDLLAARIAAYSHSALDVVGHLAMHGQKEETQLRASTDLLDRAGVKAKDNAERNSMNNRSELRIIVVDGKKDVSVDVNLSQEDEDDFAAGH